MRRLPLEPLAAGGAFGFDRVGFPFQRVLDLLEDLAHPRPHQLALLRRGVVIAPAGPGRLAGVELVVHG